MSTNTFTAIRNGRVFLERGTWSQVSAILEKGYCVSGRDCADETGNVVIYLGIVIRHVGYATRLQGSAE